MNELVTVSLAERPDLLDEMNRIGGAAWPEFMLHDPVAIDHWSDIVAHFKAYQLILLNKSCSAENNLGKDHVAEDKLADDNSAEANLAEGSLDANRIAAIVNCVPLRYIDEFDALPNEGVDWGVKEAISNHAAGLSPNTCMGVQVVVSPEYLGKGLSELASKEMLALAKQHHLDSVIVPLRPSNKHEYPLIPMEDYLRWDTDDGLPFDDWLRIHVRLGGKVIGVCSNSMTIPGTVEEWRQWTGRRFPGSGDYVVPGALNPVQIDVPANQGIYREPNIWVVHQVS